MKRLLLSVVCGAVLTLIWVVLGRWMIGSYPPLDIFVLLTMGVFTCTSYAVYDFSSVLGFWKS